MTTNEMTDEMKCKSVLNAIQEEIDENAKTAREAMLTIETMRTNVEEFKNACRTFMVATFVMAYLDRIKGIAETGDIKSTENIIRYHAYYQGEKGGIILNYDDLSLAQVAIIKILNGLINRFFNN